MHNIPDEPSAVAEMAMTNELEGRRILEQAKESANDPLAKATFEFLATEELHHIELIKEFGASLTGEAMLDTDQLKTTPLAEAAKEVRGIFERFATQFETTGQTDHERLEVYSVAMDMERRGFDFYSGAAAKMKDENSRKLFEFLASEEQRHFRMIQDTHDFLEHPDGLMAMEERWMQT